MARLDSVPNSVHTKEVGASAETATARNPRAVLSNNRRTRTGAGLVADSGQGRSPHHWHRSDEGSVRMADRHALGKEPQGRSLGSPIQPRKSADRASVTLLSPADARGAARIH